MDDDGSTQGDEGLQDAAFEDFDGILDDIGIDDVVQGDDDDACHVMYCANEGQSSPEGAGGGPEGDDLFDLKDEEVYQGGSAVGVQCVLCHATSTSGSWRRGWPLRNESENANLCNRCVRRNVHGVRRREEGQQGIFRNAHGMVVCWAMGWWFVGPWDGGLLAQGVMGPAGRLGGRRSARRARNWFSTWCFL